MNKIHLCRYYNLYEIRTLNEVIKKNCENCLFKIFSCNIKILFKKDRQKEDFLFKCVKFDNVNFLKIILNSEYSTIFQLSINNENKKGKTILDEAITNLKIITDDTTTKCLDLLVSYNSLNLNSKCYLHHILYTIINPQIILKYLKLLINKGSDPKQKDISNNTLLHSFFKRENVHHLKRRNITPECEIEILKFLLSLGIDINAKNIYGESILKLCIYCSHNEEFLKILLLDKNILINELDDNSYNVVKYAPIHHIISRGEYNYLDILLKSRSDVNINIKTSNILHTPLHLICQSEHSNAFNILKLLLEYGSQIDERCSAGLLPSDYAKLYSLENIYNYIIEYKIFLSNIIKVDISSEDNIQISEDICIPDIDILFSDIDICISDIEDRFFDDNDFFNFE